MLYLDKYSNRRLMKGREHPHFLLSTITANLFVYAQAFEFFFFKFAARNAGFLREVTVKCILWLVHLSQFHLIETLFFLCYFASHNAFHIHLVPFCKPDSEMVTYGVVE